MHHIRAEIEVVHWKLFVEIAYSFCIIKWHRDEANPGFDSKYSMWLLKQLRFFFFKFVKNHRGDIKYCLS